MHSYYPPITPYQTHHLHVDPPHILYVEECGNPNGVPILVLHNGPGIGCHDLDRCFFDPSHYRIILFDQRGCGRSAPFLELMNNDTQHLLADMEHIRQQLKVEKWMLFGTGWGSTLALAYAQKNPQTVIGLILQGISLNRNQDVKWLFGDLGAKDIFPEYWQDLVAILPPDQHHGLLPLYSALLTGEDEIAKMRAAKAWSQWKAKCTTLELNSTLVKWFTQPNIAMSFASLECHYLINNHFLEPNQILNQMPAIANLPGIIIHGRYDMICPFANAWLLHNAWPQSNLHIIPTSGHAHTDAAIVDAIIHASKEMRRWS